MDKPIVYLKEPIHPNAVAYLTEHAEVVSDMTDLGNIEAIITRGETISRELMEGAPNLKVIGKHGVGYDNIDIEAARDLGKRVVFTPGCNTEAVAELAVTHMLNICRKAVIAMSQMKQGEVDELSPAHLEGIELQGKTLGVVGAGRIGFRIAEILKNGFGAQIVIYDPYLSAEDAQKRGFDKVDTISELCSVADIINISVPLSDSTYHLFNADCINKMKPSAVLVNTARGGIVDEDALYDALVAHRIRGAGMDVFEDEPISKDNKLLTLDNFTATPHIGACTEEAMLRVGMKVVEEVLDVLAGKEPEFPVV